MIINATCCLATEEQRKEGVVDLPVDLRVKLQELLTFDYISSFDEMRNRSRCVGDIIVYFYNNIRGDIFDDINDIIEDIKASNIEVMIGGVPYYMNFFLQEAIRNIGAIPVYSFQKRVLEEYVDENGHVVKMNVFKHVGFVRK